MSEGHEDEGRRVVGILAGGAVVLFIAHCVVSLRMKSLVAVPDEAGFLGNAWLLGHGRPGPLMIFAPVYKVGYSLALAPMAAVLSTPRQVQLGAIVVNALLLSALVPVLYVLLGRLTGASRTERAAYAVVGAAMPAAWVAVPLARPDGMLMFLFAATVLALWAMASPGRWWARVWFGPAMAWLWVTHDRFLPLLVLAVLLLVVRLIWPGEDADRRIDGINLGLLALTAVAGWGLNRWAVHAHWLRTTPSATEGLGFGDIGNLLKSMVGQWWYLVTSTYGLAGIGFVLLGVQAARAFRRGRVAWTERRATVSVFVVLGLLSTQLAAAVQLRRLTAFDLVVNGRYQEVVLPLLVAIGLAKVVEWAKARELSKPLAVAAVVVVVGGVLVDLLAPRHKIIETASVSGSGWAMQRTPGHPVIGPCILALVGMGVLALVGRYRPRAMVVAVLIVFSVLGIHESNVLVQRSRPVPVGVTVAAQVRKLGVHSVSLVPRDELFVDSAQIGWTLAGDQLKDYREPGGHDADVLIDNVGLGVVPKGSRLIHYSPSGKVSVWALPGAEQKVLAQRGLLYPPSFSLVPTADRKVGLKTSVTELTEHDGKAVLDVTVTNDGSGTVWPSPDAPGAVPVQVVAIAGGGHSLAVPVPELRPHQSKVVQIDLGKLAPDHGSVQVLLGVNQTRGRSHFTTTGGPITAVTVDAG